MKAPSLTPPSQPRREGPTANSCDAARNVAQKRRGYGEVDIGVDTMPEQRIMSVAWSTATLRILKGAKSAGRLAQIAGRWGLPMETTPTVRVETEYVMTLCAEMDPPQRIDDTLSIFNVTGGWAKGPKINATIVPPAADWIQSMPDGSRRLDVRLILKTEDGALIYMSYNGVILNTDASREKQIKGEVVTADDRYCVSAPTFRTSHPKYAWLNATQAIGKFVESSQRGNRYIKYDVFAINQ